MKSIAKFVLQGLTDKSGLVIMYYKQRASLVHVGGVVQSSQLRFDQTPSDACQDLRWNGMFCLAVFHCLSPDSFERDFMFGYNIPLFFVFRASLGAVLFVCFYAVEVQQKHDGMFGGKKKS